MWDGRSLEPEAFQVRLLAAPASLSTFCLAYLTFHTVVPSRSLIMTLYRHAIPSIHPVIPTSIIYVLWPSGYTAVKPTQKPKGRLTMDLKMAVDNRLQPRCRVFASSYQTCGGLVYSRPCTHGFLLNTRQKGRVYICGVQEASTGSRRLR